MKGVDIFCKSDAATSICLSMDTNSTSSPSSATLLGGGGRAIDRHNPIIGDSKRASKPTYQSTSTAILKKSWSCTNPGAFLSPPGHLLREKLPVEECPGEGVKMEDPAPSQQVVVLKVSLHCRGCERKLRKHLSKMEGVTSFDIDFAAKKVTVAGNATPLVIVSSISKIKNAQLWTPSISFSSSSSSIVK